MKFEGLKIYGVCLERLQYQIEQAMKRADGTEERIVLESYMTSDPDEIIQLLELFDVIHKDMDTIMEKLKEVADDVSLMVKRRIEFDFSEDGELCLFLRLK